MTIITGWRAIAQTFGVTQSVTRDWREQGAPILLLPGGKKETVPAANVPELWEWLSSRYGPAASSFFAGEGDGGAAVSLELFGFQGQRMGRPDEAKQQRDGETGAGKGVQGHSSLQ